MYLPPEQWDSKKQAVRSHPNQDALNRMLREYITELEKKELQLWQQGKLVTLELLKFSLEKTTSTSFLLFYEKEVTGSSLKESTKTNHLSTLKLLREFKSDISFSEVTFELIAAFDAFLQVKGYHTNTITKHMKQFKRHVNIAINKDLIDIQQYAFRKYKIKTKESSHTHLTPLELQQLEELQLSEKDSSLQGTLDAFLFCCYTGLRYSDFINLTSSNIISFHKETWLVYKTIKTGIEIRLPLYLLFNGKCLKIIEKYRFNLKELFRIKENSHVNKELVRISRLAKIHKRISFHTARHTNATLLLYKGANITTVQKLLGHKSVKTTQIYSNIMDTTIVRDLEKCNKK